MKYINVEEFCHDNGFTSRKQRYEIMEKYFGISAETIKEITSFDRYLRDVFPVDEKGIELEKKWHNTSATREVQAWDSAFKRNALDA